MMRFNIETIRTKLARTFAGLFTAPYLPTSLIRVGMALATASLALVLLGQPLLYWMDNSQGTSSLPFLSALLQTSPLAYLAAAVAYLALAWAVIGLLTRRLALVAWLTFAYVHLAHLLLGLGQLLRIPSGKDPLAGLVSLAEQALTALLLGATLSIWLLRRRPVPAPEPEAAPMTETADAPPPAPRRRRARAWQVGLALSILLIAGAGAAVWSFNSLQNGWRVLKPEHTPGKRTSAAVAYDSRSQRTLLFGGASQWLGGAWKMHDELWAWDGSDWTLLQPQDPAILPQARMNHAMAFDEQRGVLVVFGGESKNGHQADTWEWDGSTWTQRFSETPERTPCSRIIPVFYYDPDLGKVVLVGGYGGKTETQAANFLHDTWTWDGRTWTEITGEIVSPPITGAAGAYDASVKNALLMNYDGMHEWAQDHWTRMVTDDAPPAREDSRMTVLPSTGIALFGGNKDEIGPFNDLWIHTSAGWQNPSPALKPSARLAHVLFYDPVRSALIVYGGYDQETTLGDMWEYPLQP